MTEPGPVAAVGRRYRGATSTLVRRILRLVDARAALNAIEPDAEPVV